METVRDERRATSLARRRYLRIAAIAIGLLPLLVSEGLCRVYELFDDPERSPFVDRPSVFELNPPRLFVKSADGTKYQIDPRRTNYFYPQTFEVQPESNSKRVFVVGGSTVAGRPYATETAFSSFLHDRLTIAEPRHTFEVINVGGVSYASYRLEKLVDELVEYQPDLVIIYTGHNEFLEWHTYDALRRQTPLRRSVQRVGSRSALVRTLVRIRDRYVANASEEPKPYDSNDLVTLSDEVEATLDRSDAMDVYVRDEALRLRIVDAFEHTLDRMVRNLRDRNIEVVLCVPASEIVDTPPFKSTPLTGQTIDDARRYSTLVDTMMNVDMSEGERVAAAQSILRMDPHHADAAYFLGRHHLAAGNYEQAIEYFTAARDDDVCPLRAPTAIRSHVESVARRHGVPAIDITAALDHRDLNHRRVPDGCVDPRLMVDHVHPSITGHRHIADAIMTALVKSGWIDNAADATRVEQSDRQRIESLPPQYEARAEQRLNGLRIWARQRVNPIDRSPGD